MGAVAQRNMLRMVKKHPEIVKAMENKEVFLPVILAIASVESGYGTTNAAKTRNNYFGIDNGRKVFNSPKEAFEYQSNLFYRKPYSDNNVVSAKTPYEQLERLALSGYYQMDNDGSLPKSIVGSASWNNTKQRWVKPDGTILKFTKQQSIKRYVDTLKSFVDDALLAIPVGKVTSLNVQNILHNINNKSV